MLSFFEKDYIHIASDLLLSKSLIFKLIFDSKHFQMEAEGSPEEILL